MAYNKSDRYKYDYIGKNNQFLGQPRGRIYGSSQTEDWYYPNENDRRRYEAARRREEQNLRHRYTGGNNRSFGRDKAQNRSNDQYSQGTFTVRSQGGIETEGNHRGKGPKGWTRPDSRIREEICEMLEQNPAIDASEIEVSIENGIVTLEGQVEDREVKRLAEDCVEQVAGVKDVQNRLTLLSLS